MYKVIRRFKDRDTGKILEVGEVYPTEGQEEPTQERINVLLGANEYTDTFIELIEDKEPETKDKKSKKPAAKKPAAKKE